MVYCLGAAFVLSRLCRARSWALVASLVVVGCLLAEAVLLRTFGAKQAYARLGVGFTLLQEVSFWLGPPAISNLLLLLRSVRREAWKRGKIAAAIVVCRVGCLSALLGNIAVDEAIVGVDAPVPF